MPAARHTSTLQPNGAQAIELLTQEAFEASQEGDWDRVATCYESRGITLQTCVIDQALAHRVMTQDEQVRAAVLVAQAALSSLLADAAQVTHQLRRLRESVGHVSSGQETMHREA
jgi:hypothetical protein